MLSQEKFQAMTYPETIDSAMAKKLEEVRLLLKIHLFLLIGAALNDISVGVFKIVLLLAGCLTCLPCIAGLYLISIGIPGDD